MKTPDIARILFILFLTTECSSKLCAAPGDLDASFDPSTGAGNQVYSVRAQTDGRFVIGGLFTSYNGTPRARLARINEDGSLDTTFDPGLGASDNVWAILVQSDGKIIVGGQFGSFAGQLGRLVRVDSSGNLDPGFNAGGASIGNGMVKEVIELSSGKILVMGSFSTFNEASVTKIIRLDADGNLDGTWDAGSGPNNTVNSALEQPDGKIVIVGAFTSVNGMSMLRLARLEADGALDTGFSNPNINGTINTVVRQSDGQLLIGGAFYSVNGTIHRRLARLNTDGSIDTTMEQRSFSADVDIIDLQPDGKIVAAGNFVTIDGGVHSRVVRLNSDGTIDGDFGSVTGANGRIRAFDLDTGGDWVFGGDFTSYDGTARNYIMRVSNDLELPATIARQPADLTVAEGSSASFAVTASGEDPLTYQWYKDGVALVDGASTSGATTPNLNIANSAEADEDIDITAYHVTVQANNSTAAVASDNTTLTVNLNVAPTIDGIAQLDISEDAMAQTVSLSGLNEGAVYESDQTLSITASSGASGIIPNPTVTFTEGDAIGSIAFTPVADAYGTATITVAVTDNGLTGTTTSITFDVVVAAVNDSPTLANVPTVEVITEDALLTVSGVTVGDVDDASVGVVIVALNGDVSISGDTSSLTFSDPDGTDGSIAFSGTLAAINAALAASIEYIGDSEFNGDETITVTVTDAEPLAVQQVIALTVLPVNDAPSVAFAQSAIEHLFESPGPQTVASFATFSPGPAAEAGQSLIAYTVVSDNPGLFSAALAIDNGGRLNYTPTDDTSGSAVVTVTVRDDGGTANGGVDSSVPLTFTITVGEVNAAPTFVVSTSPLNVTEDAAAQTLASFLNSIDDGDAAETQAVSFALVIDNSSLFSAQPAIASDGTLTYTLAANQNGTANITITATDDGPTVGGVQPSSTDTFQIVAAAVNDNPTLANVPATANVNEDETVTLSGITVADIDSATVTVSVVAGNGTLVLSGDTTGLTLTDVDGSDGNLTFSGAPADLTATLAASIQYSGNADANGADTLTVNLNDGEAENNTALAQTTITVTPVNDEPSFAVNTGLLTGGGGGGGLETEVTAWGYNSNGQSTIPAGLSDVTTISAGNHHSLALKSDGTVVAWGRNNNGETTIPAGLSDVTAIAAGGYHNLALKSDGTVVAWGLNAYGETTIPAGLSDVTAISAGARHHSLALKSDGT
ncbi:MAG: putative delta-60 repeat protein, partial [Limisphaerales bacterium]